MFFDEMLKLFALPFSITLLLAGIISLVSRGNSKAILLPAGSGIAIAWTYALVNGIPSAIPESGISVIPYVILIGLLSGSILDHLIAKWEKLDLTFIAIILDLAFTTIIIFWMIYKINVLYIIVIIVWVEILRHSRFVAHNSYSPIIYLIAAGIGLSVISWINGDIVDRNISFGIVSSGFGIAVWLFLKKGVKLGHCFYWSSYTALLLIAIRILNDNHHMIPSVLLLALIFYADTMLSLIRINTKFYSNIVEPLGVAALTLLPILLAAAAAFIATIAIRS